MYKGVILLKHLKTRVAFLYLTLSENGTQFSLANEGAIAIQEEIKQKLMVKLIVLWF